jgi:alpha-L-fucosidase
MDVYDCVYRCSSLSCPNAWKQKITVKECLMKCPNYLAGHTGAFKADPRRANLDWFAQASYGLFMHYGLYSQLETNEWALLTRKIPVAEYEKLADTFNPSKFDADFITDLACEAGMKYVNITTCHHEGFCLWDSRTEPFNAMKYAGRDLVRELAVQCDKKGLGFFAYYTHVLNWRHPYAISRDVLDMGRPAYPNGDPRYLLTKPAEWRRYWDYAQSCIRELCEMEAPLAGIWLDIISAYYLIPELIPIEQTYEIIRKTRPEALISFKQGATGTEDFAAPEFHFKSQGDVLRKKGREDAAAIADAAWEKNRNKHNEICMTLQEGSWGYKANTPFRSADVLWSSLGYARSNNCNLLANVGPMPDGSFPEEAVKLLRDVGKRIKADGLPGAEASAVPQRPNKAQVE